MEDLARLYVLALKKAPAGTIFNATSSTDNSARCRHLWEGAVGACDEGARLLKEHQRQKIWVVQLMSYDLPSFADC